MADSPRGEGGASLTRSDGTPIRVAHLTTVDMSLELLLGTELEADVEAGLVTYGISAPGPYVDAVSARGVQHVPIPCLTRSWNPSSDARAARELFSVLRRLELDVLHTHNPKTGVLGRILGRAARVPVIVNTCHGLWAGPDDPWARRLPVYALEMAAAKFSDAELYQNAQDAATIGRVVTPRSARVVGNGTDLRQFVSDDRLRARLRAELNLPEEAILVGGVGRLVQEKGINEFAAMASALSGRAQFVWIGPDDHAQRDTFSGRLDSVRFLGARNDMPAVYNALDIFVLPSYREGFSRSAMEAAACGTPMVLSDIRGCRELGTDGEHCLLATPRDPVDLTRKVDRLLDDTELRSQLAVNGQQRAHTHFDQRNIARMSLSTYAEVAKRKGLDWSSAQL